MTKKTRNSFQINIANLNCTMGTSNSLKNELTKNREITVSNSEEKYLIGYSFFFFIKKIIINVHLNEDKKIFTTATFSIYNRGLKQACNKAGQKTTSFLPVCDGSS